MSTTALLSKLILVGTILIWIVAAPRFLDLKIYIDMVIYFIGIGVIALVAIAFSFLKRMPQ